MFSYQMEMKNMKFSNFETAKNLLFFNKFGHRKICELEIRELQILEVRGPGVC